MKSAKLVLTTALAATAVLGINATQVHAATVQSNGNQATTWRSESNALLSSYNQAVSQADQQAANARNTVENSYTNSVKQQEQSNQNNYSNQLTSNQQNYTQATNTYNQKVQQINSNVSASVVKPATVIPANQLQDTSNGRHMLAKSSSDSAYANPDFGKLNVEEWEDVFVHHNDGTADDIVNTAANRPTSLDQLPLTFEPGMLVYDPANDHSEAVDFNNGLSDSQKEVLEDLAINWVDQYRQNVYNNYRSYYYAALHNSNAPRPQRLIKTAGGESIGNILLKMREDGQLSANTHTTDNLNTQNIAEGNTGRNTARYNEFHNAENTYFGLYNGNGIDWNYLKQQGITQSGRTWMEDLYQIQGYHSTMLAYAISLYDSLQGMLYGELYSNNINASRTAGGHATNTLSPYLRVITVRFQKENSHFFSHRDGHPNMSGLDYAYIIDGWGFVNMTNMSADRLYQTTTNVNNATGSRMYGGNAESLGIVNSIYGAQHNVSGSAAAQRKTNLASAEAALNTAKNNGASLLNQIVSVNNNQLLQLTSSHGRKLQAINVNLQDELKKLQQNYWDALSALNSGNTAKLNQLKSQRSQILAQAASANTKIINSSDIESTLKQIGLNVPMASTDEGDNTVKANEAATVVAMPKEIQQLVKHQIVLAAVNGTNNSLNFGKTVVDLPAAGRQAVSGMEKVAKDSFQDSKSDNGTSASVMSTVAVGAAQVAKATDASVAMGSQASALVQNTKKQVSQSAAPVASQQSSKHGIAAVIASFGMVLAMLGSAVLDRKF
ncbi:hypothetical protein [Limosilactobacillus sp.]|uniref:hypothetical protein n=1 Tax=Limosilactobacillus sp. TaxID=2773925 RepID=UPI00345E3905